MIELYALYENIPKMREKTNMWYNNRYLNIRLGYFWMCVMSRRGRAFHFKTPLTEFLKWTFPTYIPNEIYDKLLPKISLPNKCTNIDRK